MVDTALTKPVESQAFVDHLRIQLTDAANAVDRDYLSNTNFNCLVRHPPEGEGAGVSKFEVRKVYLGFRRPGEKVCSDGGFLDRALMTAKHRAGQLGKNTVFDDTGYGVEEMVQGFAVQFRIERRVQHQTAV